MDELSEIKEAISTIKETLVFLVEQEKVRGEEVAALNNKIDAVNELVTKQIVEPAIQYYNEEQFNKFNDQYGERLGKYDELMKSSLNQPDYSSTREAWNELQGMSDEERDAIDMDKYVEGVESGIADYVAKIKEQLGLPAETDVEIKADENGVEVKADTDGDGDKEVVAEEKEEVKEDVEGAEDEPEVDPELAKELEAYASK
jgi:hypothetical protein